MNTNSANKNGKEAIKFHLKSHKKRRPKYNSKTKGAQLTTTITIVAAGEKFLYMTAVYRGIQLKRHTCTHKEKERRRETLIVSVQ